jgi:hypothetical protein
MTKGQEFAKTITRLNKIGARTRRYRKGADLFNLILDDVQTAVASPFTFSESSTKALASAWTAVTAYHKHIDGGRARPETCLAVKSLSPYHFAQFLGRMIDAEISNMYEAEQWLATVEV